MVLDYNTNFKSPGQVASRYAPDRFRTSDHDSVLIGLAPGAAPTLAGVPGAATVGQPYHFAFTVGGTPPVAVSLAAGALPPGIGMSSGGVLDGTPTAGGSFDITVTATNAFGTVSTPVTLVVDPAATSLSLASSANPSPLGQAVTFTATVNGPAGTAPPARSRSSWTVRRQVRRSRSRAGRRRARRSPASPPVGTPSARPTAGTRRCSPPPPRSRRS